MPYDLIPASEKLLEQIGIEHTKIEAAIKQGDLATIRAVAELAGGGDGDTCLNADADEAEALVRATVIGRSALVGARIVGIVQWAIYQVAIPAAEKAVKDMERSRRESADDALIERAVDARVAA